MFRKYPKKQKSESIKVESLDYESAEPPKREHSLVDTAGTFFSKKTHDCGALVNQPVINVNVNVGTGESDLLGCFKACFGCVGTAAKGAAGA